MNEILQKRIEEAAIKVSDVCEPCDYGDPFCGSCHRPYMYDAAKKMGEVILNNLWISVEEALPTYDKAVIGMDYMPELAWDDQTIIFVHRSNNPDVVTDKNKFCVYPPRFCKVTHWMEIPSLKGGER